MKRTRKTLQPLAVVGLTLAGISAGSAGTNAYRDLILGDAPIVYYEFDETSGTTAFNSATTGATYDGTFNTAGGPVTVNQASFAAGGTAYDFGGGFIGAASAVANSLDEWTVEAWVNYDPAKSSASNFLSNDQVGWNDDVLFGIGAEAGSQGVPAGSVGLIQQGSPGTTRDFVGSPLAPGQWHHVVVTGSTAAGALTLYVDGVLAGSDTSLVNGATFNGADGIGTANLTIGAARPNAADAGYRPYDGLLDEVAVYDKVLGEGAIASHFNAGIDADFVPIAISSIASADGGVWELTLEGHAATDYEFRSSTTLSFSPGSLVENLSQGDLGDPGTIGGSNDSVVTTDGNGDATVRLSLDGADNFVRAQVPGAPGGGDPEGFGLAVATYAPGGDPIQFRWPTHIAFGPGQQEIVTDLKNNRLVYRDEPAEPFQASPVPVSGPHSVVYNPADGLYYADDTENHRIIAFADLSSGTIAAQTNNIAGVALNRPHDILIDPATGWIYALNPNSGHVFRFTAIGENESAIQAPMGGYARALTFANGKLYAIGSAKGRIVEIVDWETPSFQIYDSYDPSGSGGSAGSWTRTGLVINDAEYFDGSWYATSYFTQSYAGGTDFDENKFIRFTTLDDLVAGNWTDLSSLVPGGMTPYFLTVDGDHLHLAIFNHESPGSGDAILRFTPVPD